MVKRWKLKTVRLEDAKPLPVNARSISRKAQSALKASLERFGYVEPIVLNERTGHIIGGHQRYSILVDKGVISATMVVVDMTPEDEMDANLTLNNPYIEGEFADPVLDLLKQIETNDAAAFSSLRLDDLQRSLESSLSKSTKEDDPTPKKTELDTRCPCCGHEWNIEAKDVTVLESGEKS